MENAGESSHRPSMGVSRRCHLGPMKGRLEAGLGKSSDQMYHKICARSQKDFVSVFLSGRQDTSSAYNNLRHGVRHKYLVENVDGLRRGPGISQPACLF